MYCALADSFCNSKEMDELSLAFLLPLPSRSALLVADLLPFEGGEEADFSQRFRATVGGMMSSGKAMCFAQQPKNSARSSWTC